MVMSKWELAGWGLVFVFIILIIIIEALGIGPIWIDPPNEEK